MRSMVAVLPVLPSCVSSPLSPVDRLIPGVVHGACGGGFAHEVGNSGSEPGRSCDLKRLLARFRVTEVKTTMRIGRLPRALAQVPGAIAISVDDLFEQS